MPQQTRQAQACPWLKAADIWGREEGRGAADRLETKQAIIIMCKESFDKEL